MNKKERVVAAIDKMNDGLFELLEMMGEEELNIPDFVYIAPEIDDISETLQYLADGMYEDIANDWIWSDAKQ